MPKFDELFDDVIFKAKVAADVAGKKTSDMVELGKLKYQAKQISWEIEKTYSKLGAIVYESKRSGENFEDLIGLAMEELNTLNARLDETEDKIAAFKKAPKSASSWAPAAEAAKASAQAAAEAVGAAAEAAKEPAQAAAKAATEAVKAAVEAAKAPVQAAAETVRAAVEETKSQVQAATEDIKAAAEDAITTDEAPEEESERVSENEENQ